MRIGYFCSLLFFLIGFNLSESVSQEVEWLEGAYAQGQFGPNIWGYDIDLNSKNEVFSGGFIEGATDTFFYKTNSEIILTTDNANGYILKKDSLGNLIWTEILENAVVKSITLEGNEYVYATGYLTDDAYFNGGNDTLQKNSTANIELFLAKFDQNNGNFIWATNPLYTGGPTTNTNSSGKTISFHKGHIYLGGYYSDSIALDNNIGFNDGSEGGPFIAKYDTSGQPLWGNFTDNTGGSGGSSSSHTVNSLNLKNDKLNYSLSK